MSTKRRAKRDLRPALVFLNGDLLAVPIPLDREEVILGRSLEADVRINDTGVSRRHAQINRIKEDDGTVSYVLKDLKSGSGILLNGDGIKEETLQNGDKLTLGEHILRFELLDEIDREYQHQIFRLLAHDDLTGLLSSRSFFSELRRESAAALQTKASFCVLMMDIDHFKLVNDTYGHLTGSKTIEEIGHCLARTLRTGDAASRFGGEEFAGFLLDAELPQAFIAAERIRETIQQEPFTVIKNGRPSDTHHVTMSIGIASFPHDSTDPIELVEMADSALYRAKRLGRNRSCAYRDLTEEELKAPLPSRHT